jgi:2-isopropylmalate synthase
VSFNADGHESWTTAGVSSDLNQAALMAIVDGFHYWLLKQPGESGGDASAKTAPISTEVA